LRCVRVIASSNQRTHDAPLPRPPAVRERSPRPQLPVRLSPGPVFFRASYRLSSRALQPGTQMVISAREMSFDLTIRQTKLVCNFLAGPIIPKSQQQHRADHWRDFCERQLEAALRESCFELQLGRAIVHQRRLFELDERFRWKTLTTPFQQHVTGNLKQ